MEKNNLQLIFEETFTDKKARELMSQVVGVVVEQAISLFFKRTKEVPPLPAKMAELKKLLGQGEVSDDIFLAELVKFYFKKTKEQL